MAHPDQARVTRPGVRIGFEAEGLVLLPENA